MARKIVGVLVGAGIWILAFWLVDEFIPEANTTSLMVTGFLAGSISRDVASAIMGRK